MRWAAAQANCSCGIGGTIRSPLTEIAAHHERLQEPRVLHAFRDRGAAEAVREVDLLIAALVASVLLLHEAVMKRSRQGKLAQARSEE
jgi:hypothetical protein